MIRLNNLYDSPVVVKTKKLFSAYRYLLISLLVSFFLFDIVIHGPDSVISTSIVSVNNLYTGGAHPEYVRTASDQNIQTNQVVHAAKQKQNRKPPRKNVYKLKTIEERLQFFFPFQLNDDGPRQKVWQVYDDNLEADMNSTESIRNAMDSWKSNNSKFKYESLKMDEVERRMAAVFKDQSPEVWEAYLKLPHKRMQYEYLRFLLIYIEGGLYADVDFFNFKPVEYWFTSRVLHNNLYFGIETDYNDDSWEKLYNRRLSFSNRCFMAKRYHPFFAKLIAKITFIVNNKTDYLKSINWEDNYLKVDASNEPVVSFTTQSILTDTLFEYLNELDRALLVEVSKNSDPEGSPHYDPSEDATKPSHFDHIFGPKVPKDVRFSYKTFSGIVAPTQVDDVIILPSISFNGLINMKDILEQRKEDFVDTKNEINSGYKKFYYGKSLKLTKYTEAIED